MLSTVWLKAFVLFYLLKVNILTLVLVKNLLVPPLFAIMAARIGIMSIVRLIRLVRLVCIALGSLITPGTPF